MRCRWTTEDGNEAEKRVHRKTVNVAEKEVGYPLILFGKFTPDQTRKMSAVTEPNPFTLKISLTINLVPRVALLPSPLR